MPLIRPTRVKAPLRYRLFRRVIRVILDLYYRNIESYGINFLPKEGRTLFIANHQAGLVDGLLIVGELDQIVRLLIKHTLWENPIVGFFASNLGMVPVYRKMDLKADELKKANPERHKKTFDRVAQAFVDRESVLIFPEGVSHDEPHLLKLRSGAARMLLETEAAHDFRLGLQWVPVSIDLERKDGPNGRVVLHFHPPHKVTHLIDHYRANPADAIEQLRLEMESNMLEITLNFASWEDRAFVERLSEIWLARSQNPDLQGRNNMLMKWERILQNKKLEDETEWKELRERVTNLVDLLDLYKLKPDDLFENNSKAERRKSAARLVRNLVFWMPMIVFGKVFWWLPTQAVRWAAKKGAQGFRDVLSTYHIVVSLVLYPAWFVLAFIVGAMLFGYVTATGAVLAAAGSGTVYAITGRKLKGEFKEILNMYRYSRLEVFLKVAESEAKEIFRVGARLWNRALARQILIEEVNCLEPSATATTSSAWVADKYIPYSGNS